MRVLIFACFLIIHQLEAKKTTHKPTTPSNPSNESDYPESETVLLRVYTSNGEFRTIDVKSNENIASICSPGTRNLYKLIVHGFAETWNMTFRWNWVSEMKREMLLSTDRDRICFVAVDWEGLARGAKYIANYWRAIENMELAGDLMASYFKSIHMDEKKIHCIGFSLGAHMCSIFGKVYSRKFGVKIGRITGLDPAGPFFKGKPITEKLHHTDADLVDIIHTSEQFGLSEKNGHMDFYADSGPSNLNACNDVLGRYENLDNVILYEEKHENSKGKQIEYENITLNEKELNKTGGLSSITVNSITSYLSGWYGKIKSIISSKPKRVFITVHQFLGCSHLMAVRFFIYSINDCEYQASYCKSLNDFKKNKCHIKTLTDYPRMGLYADKSDEFYKKSMGSFFVHTYEKPPYCLKTAEGSSSRNVSGFFKYFFDRIRPNNTKTVYL